MFTQRIASLIDLLKYETSSDSPICSCQGCPLSLLEARYGKCCQNVRGTADDCRGENVECAVKMKILSLLWNKV